VLTLCPFLGLLYLLLAQVAATDPRFLRHSRVSLQDSLGLRILRKTRTRSTAACARSLACRRLSSDVVSKLYSAEGTASLRAILTLVGILGLSYAGVAWIDTIRHGLRSVWAGGSGAAVVGADVVTVVGAAGRAGQCSGGGRIRGVRSAAVVSGVGLSLLAAVAMALLPLALSDPYGIVVVILALMLWVSASVRVMRAMAVWSATT
ncbi:MAG TPA: hypothetical protein VG317_10270, partial [Pseudonocardiaceae bacterium]|nr:hypothetical protein [Pseudonocardiaceae bacterium]